MDMPKSSKYVGVETTEGTKLLEEDITLSNEALTDSTYLKDRPVEGSFVYIWDCSGEVYKVGRTDNLQERAKSYFTTNAVLRFVHLCKCSNSEMAIAVEKRVHRICQKNMHNRRPDYFKMSLQKLRKIVDHTCNTYRTEAANLDSSSDASDVALEHRAPAPGVVAPNGPEMDARRFFHECFVLDPDSITRRMEIRARHRIWSRSNDDLMPYLEAELDRLGITGDIMKGTGGVSSESDASFFAYKGLRMLPLRDIPTPDDSAGEPLRFAYARCVVRVTGRLTLQQIHGEFYSWKKTLDPEVSQSKVEEGFKHVKQFFKDNFVGLRVFNGSSGREGFLGVCFRGNELVGQKLHLNKRKAVEAVSQTGVVVQTYDSVTHAAEAFGVEKPLMSYLIQNRKTKGGYMFRLAEPLATKARDRPDSATAPAPLPVVAPPFEQFFAECCVLDDSAQEKYTRVVDRYRLWSRSNLQNTSALQGFLERKVRKVGPQMVGMSMVPLPKFELVHPDPFLIHRFLYEKADVDASRNVTLKALEVAFRTWLVAVDPTITVVQAHKALTKHLAERFLKKTVFKLGMGYYGVFLKDCE
jgi:predicted GIY-YIG superfamily endonuclease